MADSSQGSNICSTSEGPGDDEVQPDQREQQTTPTLEGRVGLLETNVGDLKDEISYLRQMVELVFNDED